MSKDFTIVLRETIDAILQNKDCVPYYHMLSNVLKQSGGNIYSVIYEMIFANTDDQVEQLEELVYFLLSEGAESDLGSIKLCCVEAYTRRMLEDLLKYYEGPLEIDFNHYLTERAMLQVSEVASGFGIRVTFDVIYYIPDPIGGLTVLEHFFLLYAQERSLIDEECEWQIENEMLVEAAKICPPPDMEKVTEGIALLDVSQELVREAYEISQGKK